MSKKIVLDNFDDNKDSSSYIVARIGHNHKGSIEKCKEFFVKAKKSGALNFEKSLPTKSLSKLSFI